MRPETALIFDSAEERPKLIRHVNYGMEDRAWMEKLEEVFKRNPNKRAT